MPSEVASVVEKIEARLGLCKPKNDYEDIVEAQSDKSRAGKIQAALDQEDKVCGEELPANTRDVDDSLGYREEGPKKIRDFGFKQKFEVER